MSRNFYDDLCDCHCLCKFYLWTVGPSSELPYIGSAQVIEPKSCQLKDIVFCQPLLSNILELQSPCYPRGKSWGRVEFAWSSWRCQILAESSTNNQSHTVCSHLPYSWQVQQSDFVLLTQFHGCCQVLVLHLITSYYYSTSKLPSLQDGWLWVVDHFVWLLLNEDVFPPNLRRL